MVNEEKVKTMTRLSIYEARDGKRYFPISKFYRSDFIGIALIRNFFLVTFGYCLLLACVAAYYGEYLMENIHKMDLVKTGIYVLVGYGIALALYTVITYIVYTVKYHRAKKSVKGYFENMEKLNKYYSRKEKIMSGRNSKGRRK